MSLGLSAAAWAGISAVGGLGIGAYSANKSNKSAEAQQQTATEAARGDPRAQAMLFGDGSEGSTGLLGRFQGMLDKPQNAGAAAFGQANDNYVGKFGAYDMEAQRAAANKLMAGNAAPQANAAYLGNPQAYAKGNMVDAPAQNKMDLTGSYDKFINGDAGANPYLTKALQGGMDQSRNVFNQMQGDARSSLDSALSGIRSNSVLAGQYGSSRQGIAEGNAIGDFAKAQQQTINQFGQANTNAAVGAQAQSFNQGQDRALSATQGLGAQQYGVASQNANTKNQAEFMNVGQVNSNQGVRAGYEQQTNLANLGAQQTNNAQNQAGTVAGTGLLGGILGTAAGQAQGQDGYDINKATQINGLLQPYLAKPGAQVQPMYQGSMAGGLLGGAAGGLALYNQFKQAGTTGPGNPPSNQPVGTYYDGYGNMPIGR